MFLSTAQGQLATIQDSFNAQGGESTAAAEEVGATDTTGVSMDAETSLLSAPGADDSIIV